ncbi:hypothetical protein IAU59_005532 [Kwoniella sp. CBS 9459]
MPGSTCRSGSSSRPPESARSDITFPERVSYQRSVDDIERLHQRITHTSEAAATSARDDTRTTRQSHSTESKRRPRAELASEVTTGLIELALRKRVGWGATLTDPDHQTVDDCSPIPTSIHIHASALPSSGRSQTDAPDDTSSFISDTRVRECFTDRAKETIILNAATGQSTVVDGPWLRARMIEALLVSRSSAAADPADPSDAADSASNRPDNRSALERSLGTHPYLNDVHAIVRAEVEDQQNDGDPGFRPHSGHIHMCDPTQVRLGISPAELSTHAQSTLSVRGGLSGRRTQMTIGDFATMPSTTAPDALAVHYFTQQQPVEGHPGSVDLGDGFWKPGTDLIGVLSRVGGTTGEDARAIADLEAISIEVCPSRPHLPPMGFGPEFDLPPTEESLNACIRL